MSSSFNTSTISMHFVFSEKPLLYRVYLKLHDTQSLVGLCLGGGATRQ